MKPTQKPPKISFLFFLESERAELSNSRRQIWKACKYELGLEYMLSLLLFASEQMDSALFFSSL